MVGIAASKILYLYLGSDTSTPYSILHSGNSSVSGGGSAGGSSITVTINNTAKTLTIPTSLPANGGTASYYTLGPSATWTSTWDCNAPDRIVYCDYGSSGRSISNAPAGWLYGTLLELGHMSHTGQGGNLNLQLMWDVAHNTTNGGTLWFRGKDSKYKWGKDWCKVLTNQNSSVSGGGSSIGSSITVDIGGTSKTLTIPATSNFLTIHDIRDVNHLPTASDYYPAHSITGWFNSTGTPDSNWYSGIAVRGWNDGYVTWQLCSYSSTGTSNNYNLYFRSGNSDWGSWKTILDSSNWTSHITKASLGLGNVQNTAFYKRSTYVNGTAWAMAGTNSDAAFTIYAPTTAGTSGQVLTSSGGTPGWTNQSSLSVGVSTKTKTLDYKILNSSTSNAANTVWHRFARLTFNTSAWCNASGYLFFGGGEATDHTGILSYHCRSGSSATALNVFILEWVVNNKDTATVIAEKVGDNVYDLYVNNYATYTCPIIYHMSYDASKFEWQSGSWSTTKPTAAYTSTITSRVNYANSAASSVIAGDSTMTIVPQNNNEINFGGTNASSTLYFGYRATGSKPIPTAFVFGGSTGSASVTADSFKKAGGTAAQLLRADGGVATFNWSGQSGQPTWLWGGDDRHSYYVYNPANFSVNYASSAGNSDTVDGYHASSFVLKRIQTANPTATAVGWYRCAQISSSNAGYSQNVIISLQRGYNSPQNEHYIFAISIGYNGQVSINQLSGCVGGQRITKVRVVYNNSGKCYFDYYMATSNYTNSYKVEILAGDCVSYQEPTLISAADGTAVEFVPISGMKSNYSMYAPSFYQDSDQTLKTNIQAILNSDNMPIIKEFDWKSDGTHSYGLIAQELEEKGYYELVNTDGSGSKTVNYTAALSLIVGKLQNKIKELEKEIENLKNKN